MVPGVAGTVEDVTARLVTGEEPQVLLALTVMLPLLVPVVTLMLFVVEVPVQPLGKVQV